MASCEGGTADRWAEAVLEANVLNASVRAVPRDDNVLNYAPGDMFAIVLYVNQDDRNMRRGRPS